MTADQQKDDQWDSFEEEFTKMLERLHMEEEEIDDEDDELELYKSIKQSIKGAEYNKEIFIHNYYIIFNSPPYPQKTCLPSDLVKSDNTIQNSLLVLRDILKFYEKRQKIYVRALKDLKMKKKDLKGLIRFFETAEYVVNNHKKLLEERNK